MYTEQEREEIESVLAVFRDYIESDETVDLAYSKKFGYLYGISLYEHFVEFEYHHIFTVEDLLGFIQGQMFTDAMEKYDTPEFNKTHSGLTGMDLANKDATERLNRILKEHNLPFEYTRE